MRYRTTFCGGLSPINGPFVQGAMAYVVWVAVSSSAAKIIWVNVWLSKASLIGICSRNHQLKKKEEMVFCYQNSSGLLWEKNCSRDREKLLKFEAEGWEFAKFLRSLEQFIRTVKGQANFWNRMFFFQFEF